MPKINSITIKNKEFFISKREISYWRQDEILENQEDTKQNLDFIKEGGIIISKLPEEFKKLDLSFIGNLNECMLNTETVRNACVWKNSIAKKLYLDKIEISKLDNKNKKL